MKDPSFVTIDPEHPLYPELLQRMKIDMIPEGEELEAARRILDTKFNWEKLVKDYNALRSQEILAFLAYGKKFKHKMYQALLRRGLSRRIDFKIVAFPVPAVAALSCIGAAPKEEIPEGEFANYACVKGEQYPDPVEHPHLAAMDAAIPRRSNRHVTSDTIPVIRDLHQVYILKLTTRSARSLNKVGRPRKGSA